MYIIIPKNQYAVLGQPISIILKTSPDLPITDHSVTQIHLICENEGTSTASYDEGFYANEYNPKIHGFSGIKRPLEFLLQNFLK